MARSQLGKLGTYLKPHWNKALTGVVALFIVNVLGVWIPLPDSERHRRTTGHLQL